MEMNEQERLMERLEQTLSGVSIENVANGSVPHNDAKDAINKFSEGTEKILFKNYPCCNTALNVFKGDEIKLLFILVIKDKKDETGTIRFFTKQNQHPTPIPIIIDQEIMIMSNTLNSIVKRKRNYTERDVINLGTSLSKKLLYGVNGVLPETSDEEYLVWIYCEMDSINHIWEWIYTESAEPFFWGDKFSIVRIPKNSNFEIERSESQINSVAILLDKTCDYAISDMKCLSNLCQHPISDYNLGSLQNEYIGPCDYMHIAADIKIIKENYDDVIEAVKIAASLSKELFIFYNIWNVEKQHSMHNIQLEVVDSIPAKTWIYTSFDVSKEFATLFANCFYDCVVEENDVAKAIKKAREEIKNGYLFSTTNEKLERDLKDRNIQEGSKEIFKRHSELSDDVFVENIAEENGIWMLSDRKNEKTYCIKKKGGKLTIYETDRNLGFNRFWRFAYVVNGNPFTVATWVRS